MSADTPHIHVSQGAATTAPSGGGMHFGASEKAASLFKAAQRHSIRVRVLKTALPVAAIALAAVFSWYTFLATPAAPVKVEVNNGGESGKLVMSNPQLNGYTKDNRPYSMIAAKAIQDAKNSGAIALEGISAELPVGDNGNAKVEAASGVYDNANGRLQLDKDFTVTTNEGLHAVMRSADVNLKSGQVTTDKPVEIRNGSTQISADTMQIKESGKVVIFENKVRVVIDGGAVSGNNTP
ncbi:LPS export ABC transporter periplasmic protein LptC [Brucella pseudogrignonensis]|jgi:lipopolysaccharide export system protein LptC|uniref:LPS export ABC transporter periplasmic protein LptC n=2 Tax=Brucella pseudogrignonensis TaxID=419475 RepID=A0A7Y3T593_9HYPH|nr:MULTISPECIES: LPS export ABC transporter periplasmic protein LptC [Brucella]MBK0020145.1 LPS export ABC transporter periplasmic protein LptC [Ochrobactrum sp. S45]MBK0043115.1 LPS export ABC transporter periplasmic protein LptC [Ochrobactrum sp. S46]MBO1024958.1 LPS export ABC transporter periplasmic protein LptC [Ochrobactrum sp. SD129]MQP39711.1 LPS export ABC transporter periplasmic protein LptC [Ochrobactrum sp. MYb237]QWK77815.1 LPS export ABC transporter periplasmic protein LptC [Ochr